MRIALDAMGGDYAPEQIVAGAIDAAREFGCEIVLVGDQEKIYRELNKYPDWNKLKISVHHATEVIEMGEHPVAAVRKKKDSSLVVAAQLAKKGECDAVISAGSTGAAVTSALFTLGRIAGIDRPTIATPIPTGHGVTLLMDSGANVDSKPRHLVQSALMGSIYSECVFGIKKPRVGLLNIGEEATKGNEQVLNTYPLLNQMHTINFKGNAEGRDITGGSFDVVVCDGFVGNIVLKFAEGLAKTLLKLMREAIMKGGLLAKVGALLLSPTLKKFAQQIDYAEYGGAPLLGVDGCYIIAHGSSNAKAIKSAIGVACEYVKQDVVSRIRENIEKEEMLADDREK
ncbi:phosphate acyltransferase PlsX [Pectinatus cerevisiiphilus]|uniref:Phosphate acyltransferase n=1 Tax=Pectinatus cerevisiiphilus TaxID=86956 RepID=A0A4R3K9M3_9FIRM|nr:phosphate acyltransferase PlsX [Pectinatus cerevisiiphilus]TCS79667.1 phosphate:acyl-[acyl carrier protein] acyltransferase [Pectinatus cerevisiiphilus]